MPIAAPCLFVVLVLAKLLVIGFVSPWLFLQDALVALVFGIVEMALRGQRKWIWMPYALAVSWVAINVPVALVLRSWLTWPMLRATGGPLADSIRYYLTPANIGPLVLVVVVGAALPFVMRRRRAVAGIVVVVAILLGGATTKAKSAGGFDRNAITTLISAGFAGGGVVDHAPLRTSLFGIPGQPDLTSLRGAARGMNIVVVILESAAAQYLGLYGADTDPMPTFTKLAANAVVFDAAYAVYPESVKGLYATLCSRSPRVGVPLEASFKDPCVPLPKVLGAAGYRTGLFHAGRFAYLAMDELVKQSGFDVADDAGAIGGVVRSSFGVDEASTVKRTIDWISRKDDPRPFFAMYMPAAGHHPYASAIQGPFKGEKEFDRYRNALNETDLALAQLVNAVSSPAIVNPTLLIVLSDHGEAFGQHEGNVGHTLAIYDENVHVPLVIAVPGYEKSVRVTSPASVLDIGPTILDLIGLAPTADTEGASLLDGSPRTAPFFADYSEELFGWRDGCWTFHRGRSGPLRSFNVCEDPREQKSRPWR